MYVSSVFHKSHQTQNYSIAASVTCLASESTEAHSICMSPCVPSLYITHMILNKMIHNKDHSLRLNMPSANNESVHGSLDITVWVGNKSLL